MSWAPTSAGVRASWNDRVSFRAVLWPTSAQNLHNQLRSGILYALACTTLPTPTQPRHVIHAALAKASWHPIAPTVRAKHREFTFWNCAASSPSSLTVGTTSFASSAEAALALTAGEEEEAAGRTSASANPVPGSAPSWQRERERSNTS